MGKKLRKLVGPKGPFSKVRGGHVDASKNDAAKMGGRGKSWVAANSNHAKKPFTKTSETEGTVKKMETAGGESERIQHLGQKRRNSIKGGQVRLKSLCNPKGNKPQ